MKFTEETVKPTEVRGKIGSMSTQTITEFLEARIAEDEAEANVAKAMFAHGGDGCYGPARVLAECAAKRAIIAMQVGKQAFRAQLHAMQIHPAFEYETTYEQAWDKSGPMPEGEGWEKNVDAGRYGDGYENHRYTDETYWRRLLPGGPRVLPEAPILRALAAVYADHEDYQPEWKL